MLGVLLLINVNKTHRQDICNQKMLYRLFFQRSSPVSEYVSLAAPKLLK